MYYKRGTGWGTRTKQDDDPLQPLQRHADRLHERATCTNRNTANGSCQTLCLHDQPHTKPGRAAWRRGRIRTMTTTRRRPQARRPRCSCRCSRRTKPAISGAISTATARTMSTARPTGLPNNWWVDWSDLLTTAIRAPEGHAQIFLRQALRAAAAAGTDDGPNAACTTNPITPLHGRDRRPPARQAITTPSTP